MSADSEDAVTRRVTSIAAGIAVADGGRSAGDALGAGEGLGAALGTVDAVAVGDGDVDGVFVGDGLALGDAGPLGDAEALADAEGVGDALALGATDGVGEAPVGDGRADGDGCGDVSAYAITANGPDEMTAAPMRTVKSLRIPLPGTPYGARCVSVSGRFRGGRTSVGAISGRRARADR